MKLKQRLRLQRSLDRSEVVWLGEVEQKPGERTQVLNADKTPIDFITVTSMRSIDD